MSKELTPSENDIQEMRADGYNVEQTTDNDGAGYIWRHPDSGATQLNSSEQPSRRTAAQAWHDLSLYLSPDGPDTPRPDWIKK
jgi:hypothetical protein